MLLLSLALTANAALGGPVQTGPVQTGPVQTGPVSTCADRPLAAATDFDLFVLEDLWHHDTDTEGAVAVGRDAVLDHYAVGKGLAGDYGRYALVVGRNLTFTNGNVFGGALSYGGALADDGTFTADGGLYHALPLDFATAADSLSALAASLGAAAPTATAQWDGARLTVTAPPAATGTVVASVDGALLGGVHELILDVPSGVTLVLNVTGDAASLRSAGVELRGGLTADHVLVNAPSARSLSLGQLGLKGSLLAPHASLQFDDGVVEGQVVVKDLAGTVQVNWRPFAGCLR